MSTLKPFYDMHGSIKKNIESLISKLKFLDDISIIIAVEGQMLSSDDFIKFFDPEFLWEPVQEKFIEYKVKKYLHDGAQNKSWELEEKSFYMNCGIVYINHQDLSFQIDFLQEFKNGGKTLVREFTYTEGTFRKGNDDTLNMIGSSWLYGVVLTALSFKESLAFKKSLVLQMTG